MTYRPTLTKTMRGPLFSMTARGWLGHDMYGARQYRAGVWVEPKWVVSNPYPIGGVGHIWIPYSLWDRKIFGMYHVPTWGLRPYPAFIAQYYSPLGWTYEMRRTWHGMAPTPKRATWAGIRHTPTQTIYRNRFADGAAVWHTFDLPTRDIYNKMKYPTRQSGYNRFLGMYIKTTPIVLAEWSSPQVKWSDPAFNWGALWFAEWADHGVKWSSPYYPWSV